MMGSPWSRRCAATILVGRALSREPATAGSTRTTCRASSPSWPRWRASRRPLALPRRHRLARLEARLLRFDQSCLPRTAVSPRSRIPRRDQENRDHAGGRRRRADRPPAASHRLCFLGPRRDQPGRLQAALQGWPMSAARRASSASRRTPSATRRHPFGDCRARPRAEQAFGWKTLAMVKVYVERAKGSPAKASSAPPAPSTSSRNLSRMSWT